MQLEEYPRLADDPEPCAMQLELAPVVAPCHTLSSPGASSTLWEASSLAMQLEEAPSTPQKKPRTVGQLSSPVRHTRVNASTRRSHRQVRTRASPHQSNFPVGGTGAPVVEPACILSTRLNQLLQLAPSVFLELFSGDGGMCQAVARAGHPSLGLDIKGGFDLCDVTVQAVVTGAIRARHAWAVWLGTECSSWSRARRGPVGSRMPRALRSDEHLWGLPGLSPADQRRADMGNAMAQFTISVIRLCVELGIPVGLENPLSSRLWKLPELDALTSLPCSQIVKLHMCQFGAQWMKPTQVCLWHCANADSARHQCRAHRRCGMSICSATGERHLVLSGLNGKHGFKTNAASVYPTQFCTELCDILLRGKLT